MKTKKLFSIFLALALVLSLLPAGAMTAAASDGLPGSGTEADPYQIETSDQLKEFTDLVNGSGDYEGEGMANPGAWAILIADIDLSGEDIVWTPIGRVDHEYAGTFDGDGHTVTGLNVSGVDCAGLFAYVSSGAEVRNVEVKNCTVHGGGSNDVYAGGVVGYNEGTVENCTVSGSSEVSISQGGHIYAGGVVGYNKGTVRNCLRAGAVTVSASVTDSARYPYAGGIVAFGSDSTVENCVSAGSGTVTASGGMASRAGGVVGHSSGKVSGCIFSGSGEIKADNSEMTNVGGVVGENSDGTVEYCAFTGSASLTGSGTVDNYVGGVVGYTSYSWLAALFDLPVSTVTNCASSGTGTVTAGGTKPCAGGVVGRNDSSIVENCCSSVAVTGGTPGGVIGGDSEGTLASCYYDNGKVLTAAQAVGNLADTETVKGLSSEAFQTQSSFSDWDFDTV